jgi:hypothetical protein
MCIPRKYDTEIKPRHTADKKKTLLVLDICVDGIVRITDVRYVESVLQCQSLPKEVITFKIATRISA